MESQRTVRALQFLLTTVRAIIQKFQTSGTVANLPGRGRKCMLSPHTVRKMVREAKKNPRTTVQELQTLDATSIPTGSLEGLHVESPYWERPTNSSVWSLPNVIGTMTGTECYGQMRPKLNFLAMYTVGMFEVRRGMHKRKSTSYLPQIWFAASGPGALVKINGIINSTKFQDIL